MNRLSRIWCCLLAVVLCVLLCAAGAVRLQAQQNTIAVLSGTVLDPVGSAVPNAAVAARNESSGLVSKASTDQEGKFSFPNLAPGNYTVEVSAPGFALASRPGVHASPEQAEDMTIPLSLGSLSEAITVEANSSGSIAAQHAPMDGLLEARSARTEITPIFIQNFSSPVADFSELTQMAPGTFAVNSNGVGLGQAKTYFRGFADGNYDIDYDGVPFYDTNDPTHHSWAFFPSPWIGSVDFDRSPGSASTIGPTPFGGTIHLLSPGMATAPLIQGSVSYGSFNTLLIDGTYDSGLFGGKKSNLFVDVHRMTSDGFETFNYQTRDAGSLKYQYKFSETNVLTAFSGVVRFDSNTPNNNPTRGQINALGYNYLLTNDSNAAELTSGCLPANYTPAACQFPLNYKFYTYNIPTDFEYVDWAKQFGHGWQTDFRPYTLSYYNAQYYNNSLTAVNATSAVDKLNSYRKYGETFVASQVSRYGIFRAGLWYEWATTNRFQTPSNPLNRVDTVVPNFHERFYTNSYQPFVEYEFRATQRLTITGGFKYAYFNQNLTQFQDNGNKVGCLGGKLVGGKTGQCVGGVPSVNHNAGYNSYLPAVDANYHLMNNWSIYGQFAEGTKVPPSAVFDVTGANVLILPKPTGVKTYQGGTVLKLKQVTLNADAYYIRFQNAFSQITDPNNTTGFDWVSSGDSASKGFEGEANVYLAHGLSFYVNGTVGTAKYVSKTIPNSNGVEATNPNYGLWVANTPSNTEAFGMTYQQKHFDLGIFDKRVGPMWNDNTPFSQVVPINPFSVTNLFLNYVVRNGSHFDQTKFRLSFNNLFNSRGIVGDQQAASGATYKPGDLDLLQLLPGRSITLTVTLGYSPKR
jgi:iron complex outermembrane receptor protein